MIDITNHEFFETSYLLQYIDQCKKGEIIIGHELMLQLDMLLEYFEDPSIQINFIEAHKRIKFIEEECKHFEAPHSGKPFILMLFQKAFIEAVYIFEVYNEEVDAGNGGWIRLHQEVLFLVSRKNGKTPLISAMLLAEWFCGEMGTKILCASNDHDQADLAFQAINAMREESKKVEKKTRKNNTGMYFGNPKRIKKKGKFSYANKGSIKKMSSRSKNKEGRNIKVGCFDESHELEDDSTVNPLKTSLSTQDEPLFIELTTEGVVNDGYLDKRMKEARQVLNKEIERKYWLIWIYTQDSEQEIWQDKTSWFKSNPGIGVIKKWSYLEKKVEESKTSKSTRVFVLAKDFNIKQNNAAAWLTPDEVINESVFDLEDFRNAFGIGGVDLARTGDLASARVILMKPNSPIKYTIQRYFIPESKLEKLSESEQKRYKEWIRMGLMEVSPGNENDFSLVTKWFVKLWKEYNIRAFKIGYDKWSSTYWVKEMEGYGFDCVRVTQDFGPLSEPMKLVEEDLKSNLINYNNNQIDKFCLENTALKFNSQEQIMPMKVQGQDDKKIDGAVTLIIAYRVYIDHRSEYLSLVGR